MTDRFNLERCGRLLRLSELPDVEVADRDPDVRGWRVLGATGETLGHVSELIVDPAAMKVRYLETELDQSHRRVLLPLDETSLNEAARRVVVPVRESQLEVLPSCPPDVTYDFSRDYDEKWAARWNTWQF